MTEFLFPLSFSQRMFWILDQLEPDLPAFYLSRVLRIQGALNVEALHDVFRALLHRHDVLKVHLHGWRAVAARS